MAKKESPEYVLQVEEKPTWGGGKVFKATVIKTSNGQKKSAERSDRAAAVREAYRLHGVRI